MQTTYLLVLLGFAFVAAHALVVPDTQNTQNAELVNIAEDTADMEAMEGTGDMEEAQEAEEAEEAEDTEDVEDTEGIEDAGVNARAAQNAESAEEKKQRRKALAAALHPEIPTVLQLEASDKPGKRVKIAFRNAKGKLTRRCTAICTNYWTRKAFYLFQKDFKSPRGCNCNCLASQKC